MTPSRYATKLIPRVKQCRRLPGELAVAPLARVLKDMDLYGEGIRRPLHVFGLDEGRRAVFGLRDQPQVVAALGETDLRLPAEMEKAGSYAIVISPQGICVAAADWRGVYHGLLTLGGIAAMGQPLECAALFDWPDFGLRGMQFLHCMNQWAPIGVDTRHVLRWEHYKEDLRCRKSESRIPPEVYDAGRPFVRFDEDLAVEIAEELSRMKMNTVLLVTGDSVRWNSHPEIALQDAWSPGQFADFARKLEALHLGVMPGFNFGPTHDTWLGKYHTIDRGF